MLRAVPEIILRGGLHVSFRPLHPQDTHRVRAPRPPGHVSALINPAPLWIKYALTPRTSYPPPLGHINKTPSPPPTGQKSACSPPRIISGTALNLFLTVTRWDSWGEGWQGSQADLHSTQEEGHIKHLHNAQQGCIKYLFSAQEAGYIKHNCFC